MKPCTSEWVAKAEGDYATAGRELEAKPTANYDAVCFHAQQCAEKYLKARLIEADVAFPKTHDLSALLRLVLPFEPDLERLRHELNLLTDIGVEVRYPGMSAGPDDARQALDTAAEVRRLLRESLGLGV